MKRPYHRKRKRTALYDLLMSTSNLDPLLVGYFHSTLSAIHHALMKTENSIHFHICLLYSFDRLQSTELFISETRRFIQLRYKQQVITKINNEELLTLQ